MALDAREGLPKGTILDGTYRIERVIGAGGFGVTYMADDLNLETTVAIKEYFPEQFGYRDASFSVRPTSEKQRTTFEWGRVSFVREARTLARFRHPSVVQVTRVFESNSTAYMVMAFEQGNNLEVWLRALGRPPTQGELDGITGPLLDALKMMHAQTFLHRDIAPDNIIVRDDGTPVLLDFGAARRAVAEKSQVLTGIIKSGYSPQEQYATDSRLQGPWTDLYAVGATLYRAVAGKPPEEATLRAMDDRLVPAADCAVGTYRASFLAAIDACLKVRPSERPQSVAQLQSMLHDQLPKPAMRHFAETRRIAIEPPKPPPLRSRPGSQKQWAAVAVILFLIGGAYGGYRYSQSPADEARMVEEAQRRAQQEAIRKTDAAAAKAAADGAKQKAQQEARRPVAVPENAKEEVTLPPNLSKQFSIVQSAGVTGEEYRIVRGSTVASCAETCARERSCVMFSRWNTEVCYLFNARFNTYPTDGAVVGKFLGERGNVPAEPASTTADGRFQITSSVAIKGDEYQHIRDTTFDRCQRQCADDLRCKAFAHWKNESCYLFREFKDTYPSTAARVGIKTK